VRYYKIVIGDSRDMKGVADGSVRLVVTSPPYWNVVEYSTQPNDISNIRDRHQFFEEISKIWAECKRVLEPGGILVVNWQDLIVGSKVYGYPREICVAGDMCESVEKSGLILISRWVWYKTKYGAGSVRARYTNFGNLVEGNVPRAFGNWEYIFAFMKRDPFNRERKLDFTRDEWMRWNSGVWYIEASVSSGACEFIEGGAVFPVELPKRFIKIYSLPGEVVLDPFLGTGTTMRAAFELGRSCIGYEVRKEMLKTIKDKVGFGVQSFDDEAQWEVIE
jgi:DNA modification methylase